MTRNWDNSIHTGGHIRARGRLPSHVRIRICNLPTDSLRSVGKYKPCQKFRATAAHKAQESHVRFLLQRRNANLPVRTCARAPRVYAVCIDVPGQDSIKFKSLLGEYLVHRADGDVYAYKSVDKDKFECAASIAVREKREASRAFVFCIDSSREREKS